MSDVLRDKAEAIVAALLVEDLTATQAVNEWLKVRDWDTQTWVDQTCHYRNLAIHLGAKPEHMLSKYDRELCENPPPDDGSGWSTTGTVELWEETERMEAALREADEVARQGKVAVEAVTTDQLVGTSENVAAHHFALVRAAVQRGLTRNHGSCHPPVGV